jgi:hypothetical protein
MSCDACAWVHNGVYWALQPLNTPSSATEVHGSLSPVRTHCASMPRTEVASCSTSSSSRDEDTDESTGGDDDDDYRGVDVFLSDLRWVRYIL